MTSGTQSAKEHGWIDPYEKIWIVVSIAVLVLMVVALTVASMAFGIQVPVPEKRVDPNVITTSGPFSEPGIRDLGGDKYEAYIVGQAWNWTPKEIRVPVGSTVTFFITSKDLMHGFMLWDTNLNIMVIPGQVSRVTITFEETGEFPFICNEYCGIGHHTMAGKVIVEGR